MHKNKPLHWWVCQGCSKCDRDSFLHSCMIEQRLKRLRLHLPDIRIRFQPFSQAYVTPYKTPKCLRVVFNPFFLITTIYCTSLFTVTAGLPSYLKTFAFKCSEMWYDPPLLSGMQRSRPTACSCWQTSISGVVFSYFFAFTLNIFLPTADQHLNKASFS